MKPIVCYVTDRKALGPADSAENLLVRVREAATAGVDWVQLRERDLPARELLALTKAAIVLGRGEVPIVVNDRLDVALAAGAAGVHLGGASLPPNEVVRLVRGANAPAGFLVGVSCHSMKEAREAESAGASYVFFGPVFDTPAKRSYGPPQGIARLAEISSAVRIPVIAIGGVNDTNGTECVSAGATGIAAIRMFQESHAPETLKRVVARLHGDT